MQLRDAALAAGTYKGRVHGCAPDTTYYFFIEMLAGETVVARWPAADLAPVTTALENTLLQDAAAVLVSLSTTAGTLDAGGWLVTAHAAAAAYPVTAYVADGAPANQAFVNLGRLFGPDGFNWEPNTPQTVTVTVIGPAAGTVQTTVEVPFEGTFKVGTVTPLAVVVDDVHDNDADGLTTAEEAAAGTSPDNPDTDGDGLPDGWEVDYGTDPLTPDADADPDEDTYTNLDEYLAGSDPNSAASTPAGAGDINGDGLVDLADAVVALQVATGVTPAAGVHVEAELTGDGKIGIEEVIYLLQDAAGLRP